MSAPPTDDQLDAALVCPMCEYALHGLSDPRCPECGYTFDWAELRDPDRRLHPYLFEHHPQRNARSFVRTLHGTLRPRKFWRGLPPQGLSSPRRLVIYWLLTMSLAMVAYAALYAASAVHLHNDHLAMRARMTNKYKLPRNAPDLAEFERRVGMPLHAYFDAILPTLPSSRLFQAAAQQPVTLGFRQLIVACALWPWATAATMRAFLWISLHRARVRAIHVARSTVYCADAMAWAWLAVALAATWMAVEAARGRTNAGLLLGARPAVLDQMMVPFVTLGWLVAAVILYRLVFAIRNYLRLPHAVLIVVLTQFIVLIEVFFLTGVVTSLFR